MYEYAYIESQIDNTMQSLRDELQQLNIIDAKTKKILNPEVFERVIESKIKELKKLECLIMNNNGIVINRYGANIWMKAISELQDMLKYKSFDPQSDKLAKIRDKSDEILQKPSLFKRIIGKLANIRNR